MTIEECYASIGGSYEQAIERLRDAKRVQKFALMFLKDDSMEKLRAAVADGDVKASFQAAHTLKGVAGNLSFACLQQAASDLTEQLRPLAAPADAALMARVEECYGAVATALASLE